MDIEQHKPELQVPPPTFTLQVTQRELDLIFVVVDEMGSNSDGPMELDFELKGALDSIFIDALSSIGSRRDVHERLGINA
jgi:hypothetical protein